MFGMVLWTNYSESASTRLETLTVDAASTREIIRGVVAPTTTLLTLLMPEYQDRDCRGTNKNPHILFKVFDETPVLLRQVPCRDQL